MKKSCVLVLFHLIVLVMSASAQKNEIVVYLTNYTIPVKGNTVGFIRVTGGQVETATVGGKHGAAFSIGKGSQLSVHPKKLPAGLNTFDIEVTVTTPSGKQTRSFTIVKDDFIRNKVVAHRGAWKNTGAPENSIAALNHAVRLGCEGSEFDVHMSSDSLPVISHDPHIQGVSIAKTSSGDLRSIKLSNGEPMPTLEDYLKAGMGQTKTKLILEIKPSELGKESSLALARQVVAQVEKLQAQAWVDYISFDYDVCREVMSRAPYARVAYLNGDKSPAELAAAGFFGLDYHFSVFNKNTDWISDAHARKLTVNVWTVNDKAALEDLLRQQVDFITTNEPELLLSLLR